MWRFFQNRIHHEIPWTAEIPLTLKQFRLVNPECVIPSKSSRVPDASKLPRKTCEKCLKNLAKKPGQRVIRMMLVGGLEHGFYFSIYWECHHPNWRTHIFQRGGSTTNQMEFAKIWQEGLWHFHEVDEFYRLYSPIDLLVWLNYKNLSVFGDISQIIHF